MLDLPLMRNATREPLTNPHDWYPELGFSGRTTLDLMGGLCICDPIYLCDAYNANDDPVAEHLRTQGVFILDLEGDGGFPVWLTESAIIVPTHYPQDRPPSGLKGTADSFSVDSASFVFFAVDERTPTFVRSATDDAGENVLLIDVLPGRYEFYMGWRDQERDPRDDWDGVLIGERKSPG